VVCAVHLRASADDAYRMQQASLAVEALADFGRGDAQIVLADVNSQAPPGTAAAGGTASTVFEYFLACGYRCAYRSVGEALPGYTTWAGWSQGDYQAVCDHIFVSGPGIHVASVLGMPQPGALATAFPERLPNSVYPSDHMSLVADLVLEA